MMMKEFLQYAGFSAPVISSLSCLVMLHLYRRRHTRAEEKPLYRMLTAYFGAVAVLWACSMIYVYYPVLYTRINLVYYIGLFWGQVVFYQFVYTLTRRPGERGFSPVHYLVPLAIVGVFAVWSAFVPFEVQLRLVTSRGEFVPGYEAYSRLFTSRLAFRGVWNIFYTVLAWWRLLGYRKFISDYSADTDRSSLTWVTLLLAISLSLVPPSLLSIIYSKQVLISSLLLLVPQIMLVVQHAVVCYNMAVGNFIVILYPQETEEGADAGEEPPEENTEAAEQKRRRFERYMRKARPYLNPELKITDLALAMQTNRCMLSRFINRQYGMNFSQYINRLRLRELETLRNDPACARLDEEELACLSGFSNFRSYVRVKKMFGREEKEREKAEREKSGQEKVGERKSERGCPKTP